MGVRWLGGGFLYGCQIDLEKTRLGKNSVCEFENVAWEKGNIGALPRFLVISNSHIQIFIQILIQQL